MTVISVSELICKIELKLTKVTEYGINLNDLRSGAADIHPSGIRFDFAFDGIVRGSHLNGTMTGIDYLYIRPDTQFQTHIHATITTNDGVNISCLSEGATVQQEGSTLFPIRNKVSFITASPDYAWLNQIPGWALGTADPGQGVDVKVYAP